MRGTIWVTDREAGIRLLFGELLPEADLVDPHDLVRRLAAGRRPEGLVIDGTQLLELPARWRRALLGLPRVLVCTGLSLTSIPVSLIAGPGVSVLAKPFCVEDLEVAVGWLRAVAVEEAAAPDLPALVTTSRRRNARPPGPTT